MSPERCLPWALALALSSVGCGGANAAQSSRTTPGEERPPPEWATSHDDVLSTAMTDLAGRLEAEGVTPGVIHGRGFLATRARQTVPLEVPAGRCSSIVTLASTGVRDIDAVLYGPSGDLLAEDVQPDSHPTIQVCGGERGRRVYLHLYVYEGAGAYLFAGFDSSDDTSFAAVARVVGGRPGVAANPGQAAEASSRVAEFTAGAARRGYRPDGAPLPVQLDRDQRIRVPLATLRGRCYSVAAFAGPGLVDVDLTVFDEQGRERARDRAENADATTQICVDRDSSLSVELHAAEGHGPAEFHILSAPDSAAGGPNGLWLGERTDERRASTPLTETLRQRDAAARADGWGAARLVAGGTLIQAEATRHAVVLPAGRCSRLEVTGGRGLGGFRVRVSGAGETIASRTTRYDDPGISLCPDARVSTRIQLTALGSGDYAVRRFERDMPAELRAASAWARGRLLDVSEALGHGDFRETSRSEHRPGATAVDLSSAGPGCTMVHAVSSSATEPVVLRVKRGDRVVSRSVGLVAHALVCSEAGAEAPDVSLRGPDGAPSWVVVSSRPAPAPRR